jgi:hypothetical protein
MPDHEMVDCPDLLRINQGGMPSIGAFIIPDDDFPDFVLMPDKDSVKPVKKDRDDRYPHRCPRCGAPAFIGFNQVDCSKRCS